ncbi:MAG: hypothetical protein QXI87_09510 [Thermoproteota archaeon]
MSTKVHRVKGLTVVKRYRILPYHELVEILREDGEAFFEDSREQPLKRQTVWKAARKLSELVGRKVRAERALLRFEDGSSIEGYSFSVEEMRER